MIWLACKTFYEESSVSWPMYGELRYGVWSALGYRRCVEVFLKVGHHDWSQYDLILMYCYYKCSSLWVTLKSIQKMSYQYSSVEMWLNGHGAQVQNFHIWKMYKMFNFHPILTYAFPCFCSSCFPLSRESVNFMHFSTNTIKI